MLAVIVIGMGVALNVAIFGFAAALKRPPALVNRPRELAYVYERVGIGNRLQAMSQPQFEYFRNHLPDVVTQITSHQELRVTISTARASGIVSGELVDGSYFTVLGARPSAGRTLGPSDDQPDSAPAVVISDELCRLHFGSMGAALGSIITLNDAPFTIVGVMPSGFVGLSNPWSHSRFWVLVKHWAKGFSPPVVPVVRLPQGLDQAAFGVMAEANAAAFYQSVGLSGDRARQRAYVTRPVDATTAAFEPGVEVIPAPVSKAVTILATVTAVIAATNMIGLLLARGHARRDELGVRKALGATPGAVARMLAIEAAVLASLGAVLGLWLARGVAGMAIMTLPAEYTLRVEFDWRVYAYAAIVAGGICVLASPILVIQARTAGLLNPFGSTGSLGSAGVLRRVQNVLMLPQIAICVGALVVSIAVGGPLMASELRDRGHDVHGLVIVGLGRQSGPLQPHKWSVPGPKEQERQAQQRYEGLMRELDLTPFQWAIADGLPVYFPEHRWHVSTRKSGDSAATVYRSSIAPSYFSVLGVDVVHGRNVDARDTLATPRVAVVSEHLADRLWGRQEALGQQVALSRTEGDSPEWFTVVGVVRDVAIGLERVGETPVVYVAMAQESLPTPLFLVRRSGASLGDINSIREIVMRVDPSWRVAEVKMMAESLGQLLFPGRVAVAVLMLIASGALGLVIIGITASTHYSVSQRSKEIGIRIAVGGTRSAVMRLIVLEKLRLAVPGIVLGSLAGGLTVRLLIAMLWQPEVLSVSVSSVIGSIIVLSCVCLAAYAGARRFVGGLWPQDILRHL